jgi:SRSO17 transposase
MRTTPRIPQAPSEPIPELAEFMGHFRVHFIRRESQAAAERYLSGLLTDHPNKNCDTLASIVPGTSEQSLQGLLTEMVWDELDLNRQRVQVMQQLPTEGDGVLICDDTGFAKQGPHSVGVARQYSGTLGKVANCQVTVNCHYAERTLAWPVATRLYLPKPWAEDPVRRAKAHVPAAVLFQAKWEIALDLLDQANAWGVRHVCVVTDADYGDNPKFLDALEVRQEHYAVAVRADFQVGRQRRTEAPAQRADQVLASWPVRKWHTRYWQEGTERWWGARFVAVRCWRVDGQGTRRIGWLIGQRPLRGTEGDWKYYWSNFPASVRLEQMVEYTHRRHWVEQFHEEAKELLGWDQYQGRLWGGFHRNAVFTFLSHSFLVWLEWRERQAHHPVGRPRGAFSPSEGSPSPVNTGDAAPGRRPATRGRHSGTNRQRSRRSILSNAEVTK